MTSFTVQLLMNSMITGSVYALVAIGFALTYNIGGFFNMAHGAVFLLGAYGGYVALHVLQFGLPLAVLVSAAAAGLAGIVAHSAVFRRLALSEAPSTVFFISSLGILIAVEGTVATGFGYETIVFMPGPSPSSTFFGARVTDIQVYILALSFALLLALVVFFHMTNIGKQIRAVADDRELAKAVGISVNGVMFWVFVLGSMLAGVAGLFVGMEHTIRPGSGMVAVLWAMVASIMGGVGSFIGPVVGAFLLGFIENLAVTVFPSEWKATVVFSILILFFFLRPVGLFGVRR
ncbi:MAG: branched-chain amino acid ABC transporter permease [Betaproteobacteria bacterium]|nr:branched-chain amino acid ABC transporter permease [Betaproteobacteria bacterium]